MPRPLLPWLCLGPLLAARAAPLDADHASLVQVRSDVSRTHKALRQSKTHLVSFRSCSQDRSQTCNKLFFQELQNLSAAVEKVPTIRQHLYQGLPKDIYRDPRWKEHVRDGLRGRGYWFWKPALVNLLLRKGKVREGDIVIWCDADARRAFQGNQVTDLWSAFLDDYDQDILVQPQPYCEAVWTKGDIFQHFGVEWKDPHYGLTMQPKAQFWVMRVNERTVKFLRYWEDLVANFSLISDNRSKAPDPPLFHDNRHDQALYSMLLKASGLETGPTEECELYKNISKNLTNQTLAQAKKAQALFESPAQNKTNEQLKLEEERAEEQAPRTMLQWDPGMQEGTAQENANAPKPANASAPKGPVLHPYYGIPGLKVVMNSFKNEATRMMILHRGSANAGETAEQHLRDQAAEVGLAEDQASGPRRELCVRDACYDLDALAPGELPSGVA